MPGIALLIAVVAGLFDYRRRHGRVVESKFGKEPAGRVARLS
jgi:hypothetical protein